MVDSKDLENALSNQKGVPEQKKVQMPQDVEIGFHEGALNTLINERNELFKMMQNVEAVMQAHITRLKELGVEIQGTKK